MTQILKSLDGGKTAIRNRVHQRPKRSRQTHPFLKPITKLIEEMTAALVGPESLFEVNEAPESWTLTTELPNMLKQDIRVLAFDGILLVNALRQPPAEDLSANEFVDEMVEFDDQIVQRSVAMPSDATTDGACVLFQSQTLKIVLPKGPRSTEHLHRLILVDQE